MNTNEEKAKFEAWFSTAYPLYGRVSPSGFRDTSTKHMLWNAWQAAIRSREEVTK